MKIMQFMKREFLAAEGGEIAEKRRKTGVEVSDGPVEIEISSQGSPNETPQRRALTDTPGKVYSDVYEDEHRSG